MLALFFAVLDPQLLEIHIRAVEHCACVTADRTLLVPKLIQLLGLNLALRGTELGAHAAKEVRLRLAGFLKMS